MTDTAAFSFGDNSVARSYDNMLGPVLFEPWADRLIEDHQPWEGRRVLDLATGTGIVAERLAGRVGPHGSVSAADINAEMLAIARERCARLTPAVTFIESPAHPLDVPDGSKDVVVCQQGIQFFPDRCAAIGEMYRVLSDGGRVVATTWCPVAECEFFGAVCDALEIIGATELSDMMRVPFDIMPEDELAGHFESAQFVNVQVRQQKQDLVLSGGVEHGVQLAYATPIGPKLAELSGDQQDQFRANLVELLNALSTDGRTMGRMTSNVVSAEKPTAVS